MRWTKEQQAAIDIRDKNILVSAAAGSGKTAVLVERIKQLIIEDGIPIDRMLVVTFSNAAASEMREKILAAITKALETPDEEGHGKPSKTGFLRQQLNNIHKANISTFHAFSMEVIRRYFYLIDVEPNFKICDEAQKAILQAEAMEQLFTELFQSDSGDFLAFLNQYALSKNENHVKEMIFETYQFIQSIPDSFAWLEEAVKGLGRSKEAFLESGAFGEIKNDLEKGLGLAKAYFLRVRDLLEDHGISSLVTKCDQDIKALEEVETCLHQDYEAFAQAMRTIKFQVFAVAKAEKEDYEEIKEDVTVLRDKAKAIIKKLTGLYLLKSLEEYVEELNLSQPAGAYLCQLVKGFHRMYKEHKEEKGLIDFNDIEHYALTILSHEEAAKEYRDKFEVIFIDEYQDSNMVQETLINKIKRKNNLFMVGDVKQSIYKFRLAEPEIFINKYEAFKEENNPLDIKLDLNKNFRSKGNIINGVNDIFSRIMKKDFSGLEYDEAAALYKGTEYEGNLDYPVEMHLVDDMQLADSQIDEEILEMKKAEVEAYTAVKLIKEARGKEIFDGKKNITRNLSNKDIVILLREARTWGPIYYEALMREGIPAFIDNSDGYFDAVEIEIFLNLLRIIDNKKQDIPLLSVLRSPIFGFTVEELIHIRLNHRNVPYHRAFSHYAEGGNQLTLREKCRETLARIAGWKREATFMSLEDFLWKLIGDTGYDTFIGAIPGGVQRQANVRALIDKAVQFQTSQMQGLFGFINYIEAIKKRKVPMGPVKLLGENDDVVRIMTIHKSKGLEFPMVVLGGLGKKFNKDRGTYRVILHKDAGLAVRLVDKEGISYKKTLLHRMIEEKKNRENLAEEIRILYVAFTRAMDKLVLLGTLTDMEKAMEGYRLKADQDLSGGNSYLDFIIPTLKGTAISTFYHDREGLHITREETEKHKDGIKRLFFKGQAVQEGGRFLQDTEVEETEERRFLKGEIKRRLSFRYPYQGLNLKSKFTVSELNRLGREAGQKQDSSFALRAPKFSQGKKDFTGAEKGTVLHKVMEYIDFRKMGALCNQDGDLKGAANYIQGFVDHLIEKEILTEEEGNVVNSQKIIRFFTSNIGGRAAMAKTLFKEVSFNIMKQVQGEDIILQGTIDCYFEEDGRYILVDYKSDYLSGNDLEASIYSLAENYREQLALYREALEKIRGIQVAACYLYLFHLDREIEM